MPIHYVEGDLFINRYHMQAYAHGCNLLGIMGGGIALQFKHMYPEMFQRYRHYCLYKVLKLGEVFMWVDHNNIVFNLMTQPDLNGATYEAIEAALKQMRELAETYQVESIGMPAIGAGLGRLDWKQIQQLINQIFADWEGTLYVYEKYVAGI